jgi:hydroxyisourate hydrolase
VGFLTCHVLDTARGCPAAGMRITLSRRAADGSSCVIKSFVTNEDGRTGRALDGLDFAPGLYEWTFHCGPYFAKSGLYTSGTPFLDEVPIRFGIDNPEDHYHVPLLVSPWSYSTYRGS